MDSYRAGPWLPVAVGPQSSGNLQSREGRGREEEKAK